MARVRSSSEPGAARGQGRTLLLTPKGRRALALTVAGVVGFVGLLVAAHYLPGIAQPLRTAALIWFFVAGFIKIVFVDAAH